MLTLDGIAARRGGKELFSGMGMTLLPGSLTLLRGPNGCGKSTLLNIIAGLITPAAGLVRWNGIRADRHPDFTGKPVFLSHANALKLALTVADNLLFYCAIHDSHILLHAAMQYWGLAPMADIEVGRLSAGWQRRVALARLLLSNSPLWLLDEPQSNLDEEGDALLQQLIASHCNNAGIAVLATHGEAPVKPFGVLQIEDFQ